MHFNLQSNNFLSYSATVFLEVEFFDAVIEPPLAELLFQRKQGTPYGWSS